MQKGLDVLVDVATLYRVGMETGLSDPLSIVKSVKRQLVNQQKGTLFAGDVLNGILDELVPPSTKEMNTLSENLKKKLSEKYPDVTELHTKEETKAFVDEVLYFLDTLDVPSRLKLTSDRIVEDQNVEYDKDLDSIYCIFDRDWKSFKEGQYDEVLSLCNQEGYKLFITNPCFEFWLFLHLPEKCLCTLNTEKLAKNGKVKGKSYIEDKLCENLKLLSPPQSYTKTKYDSEFYMQNLVQAISNVHHFSESLLELKTVPGSNLSCLLKELQVG